MSTESRMAKKTVKDIEVRGKRVLVRVDFNVPLDPETGEMRDDTRIRAVLPTIKYLLDNKAKLILCSHLGRPQGKVVDELRFSPVAERLSELIGSPVEMAKDCIGPEVEEAVSRLVPYTAHTHITDARRHTDGSFELVLVGQGELDATAYVRAMHEAGWDDFITLEVSAMVWSQEDYDPTQAAQVSYDAVCGAFERAGVPRG